MKARVAVMLLALVPILPAAGQNARPPAGESAGWALSKAQVANLAAGAVIAEADVAADRAVASIRAAVQIDATPEHVFRTLTDCTQALRFVPHLKRCAVLETAPDASWQEVEQHVDYGWLLPRAHYVFHADYERYRRIRFYTLRGDFQENHGVWEFQALQGGRATLVTYQARVAPSFFVPRWMMRSMLKRDLPELMLGLRVRSEAVRSVPATGAPRPASP